MGNHTIPLFLHANILQTFDKWISNTFEKAIRKEMLLSQLILWKTITTLYLY
jgi:hypothetical protein